MQDPQNPDLIADTATATAAANSQSAVESASPAHTLEDQLKKALLDAAEHHDAWLRAKADADNIRKRAQADISSAHKYAIENFASELLAVRDSLEAALLVDNATLESYKSGMELTLKQLSNAFDKFNLKQLNPDGEKFDPRLHQAIAMVEAEAAANTVVSVMQKGYALNERVLRPALVTVARQRTEDR